MLQLITIIQGKWWVSFVTLCLSVHKIIPDNYFDCLSALSLNASCEVLYDTSIRNALDGGGNPWEAAGKRNRKYRMTQN